MFLISLYDALPHYYKQLLCDLFAYENDRMIVCNADKEQAVFPIYQECPLQSRLGEIIERRHKEMCRKKAEFTSHMLVIMNTNPQ